MIPCKKCGKIEKYKNGDCATCSRARAAKSRKKNREVLRERDRKWRKANPNYGRKWRKANLDYMSEYGKKWRKANPNYTERGRKWREANPGYMAEYYRKRKKKND